jgi:thiol-disulfide isomerase/thioredoxin
MAAAATAWIGCSRTAPEVGDVGPASTAELTVVDRAGYDAVVASKRGEVVLVDMWATWCLPCVEQLGHTVDLENRYRDRGLAVVTLSMDEPDNLAPVRAVLDAKGADRLTNLISKFGSGPQSIEAFEIPGGALPHYKLYDRSGKLRQTFAVDPAAERQFTPADIDAAVAELLAE